MKIFLPILLLLSFTRLQAQSLKRVSSFGNNGQQTVNFGMDGNFYPNCILPLADGKILVGGEGLTRFTSNADLDNSFAVNGLLTAPLQEGYVDGLAEQADAKIIMAVTKSTSGILLQRLQPSGTTDSSFGTNGNAYVTHPDSDMQLSKIKIQPDGKILVLVNFTLFSPEYKRSILIARLNTNGSPDLSFNGSGKIIVDIATDNFCGDIALQSDGKILVAGYANHTILYKLILFRLNTNGTRDMGFNGTGHVEYASPGLNSSEQAELLYVYNDNKILIVGRSDSKLLLMRLQSDGARDNSFNGNGLLITSNALYIYPRQVHVLPSQKILITAKINRGVEEDGENYAAYQFTSAGLPDATFNGNGFSELSPSPENDNLVGSKLNADGSLLMFGNSGFVSFINTAKINSAGIFDTNYGDNGLKITYTTPSSEEVKKVFRQTDGKLLTLSSKNYTQINNATLVISRFNINGSLDNTFGANGHVYYPDGEFYLESAFLLSDGKLLVAGSSYDPAEFMYDTYITRLNANGTPDESFGTLGRTVLSTTATYGTTLKMALAADGKIIIATSVSDDEDNFHIYRLLTNGNRDNSFAPNGVKEVAFGLTDNYLEGIALQADGKILLSGSFYDEEQSNYFCMRLTSAANIDNSFSGDGIYTSPATESAYSESISIVVTKDQKIMLTGLTVNSTEDSVYTYVSKLLSNGTPDLTFNGTGTGKYFQSSNNYRAAVPMAAALHPDSSLYITGNMIKFPDENVTDSYIIRIKKNGSLDSSLSVSGDGWHFFAANAFADYEADIHIGTDSVIYIGGSIALQYDSKDLFLAVLKRLPDAEGRVYVFNGNGSWTNPANWTNSLVPPQPLPAGSTIIVDPAPGSTSILDTPQSINAGGSINVKPGSKLLIQGNLIIAQ